MSNKKAVILAGGKGTRLRPYTSVLPKPLMPIGDYPILEVIIRQLKNYDVTDITLAVNHQAELIRAYFGSGDKLGVKISYSIETKALNTMGPLRIIEDLPEDFLVMNGDVLTDLNYASLYNTHKKSDAIFTISAMKRTAKIDYGVLEVDKERLVGFNEKPHHYYDVSMGVYMVNRKTLEFIPPDQSFGFDELMHTFLDKNIPVSVYPHEGLWLDIGRPDDYMQAIDNFEEDRDRYLHE
ncbi:MAG: NDP-sugar synthase [Suipraeoptans sp.]